MKEIRRLIDKTEADLRAARVVASHPGHPRRFLEFDTLCARIRLQALREALAAVSKPRGLGDG